MRRTTIAILLAGLAGLTLHARAQKMVSFASLDRNASGDPVALAGRWFARGSAPAPAALLLHGCGGPYDTNGRLSRRLRDYAALLNAQGYHALVLDSFSPRGESELCTQRSGTRRVTQVQRRLDALAALEWLAQRADVRADRIGLIGWSNGGSTVLAATNLRQRDVHAASRRAAFGVAFYPGCEAELKRGYTAGAPLLLLLGQADDWTAAGPCQDLAARAPQGSVSVQVYAGAHHGFDSDAPLRLRRDVPNGVNPGQGVHVGGDPQALQASREALLRFLAQQGR